MITINQLTHRFGTRTALDHVSLEIPRGCLFGLLGPNGSGKSTLFRILTTLLEPTQGTASIDGYDVVAQRAAVRERIAVVFQHPSLDGKLTALENMLHHGMLYGLHGHDLRTRSLAALDRLGLRDRAADRAEILSGGQKRRLEIAKCLLHIPRVLLLDEPSTGLDPGARQHLMSILLELQKQQGMTILLSTHLMEEADQCERLALLDEGRLLITDTPYQLKRSIGGDIITLRTTEPAQLATAIEERWHKPVTIKEHEVQFELDRGHEAVPAIASMFADQLLSITVGQPTLGDVFLRMTGKGLSEDAVIASQAGGVTKAASHR